MKRKWLGLFMTAALVVTSLSGCGYKVELPTEKVKADIFVEPIEDLPEDFIKGMDISSVLAEEESGVVYYDEDGKEADLFQILADAGINTIRVRVWNDPYDADGNGYGGGNNDVEKAGKIGKRASKYGMKLLVDFHYSDTWADPNKQYAPKEWIGLADEDKEKKLYDFTLESLKAIKKAGADISMVQIGNEINNGLASEYKTESIMGLLKSGSKAVRKFDEDVKIAVHYTEIDDVEGTMQHAKDLEDAKVDYDVFGVSYYPFWHGTMENMTEVLSTIKETYGKDTCVLETSYLYTDEDGDASGNSVGADMALEEYPVGVQGQVNCVRDVMAAANKADALGVFYWEGAWIPVGSDYTTNLPIWEKYGSGWASSYCGEYDPKDAGQYYGGSSWDNQAFFDFEGHVLPSLNVFKYVNYGAECEPEILAYKNVYIESGINAKLTMPETVEAIYNDPNLKTGVPITWDKEQLDAFDTSVAGLYEIDGVTEDGTTLTAKVKICNVNYIKNPSFEDKDASMWVCTGNKCTDVQNKTSDAVTGDNAYHFYSENAMEFEVEQKIENPQEGIYNATANIQGGDVGANAEIYLYVRVGDEIYKSQNVELTGWVNWKTPEVLDVPVDPSKEVYVGMHVKSAAKGWGTMDDFEFYCR